MDYETIQRIAAGVVDSSSACDGQLFEGTVTSAEPLKISLGEGGIELDGDDIILTQSVVKKLLYIKTHTHKIGSDLQTHTHPFVGTFSGTISGNPASGDVSGTDQASNDLNSNTTVVTTALDAWCTEYGHKLPREPKDYKEDADQIVITLNRGLEVDDKVIMTRVSSGQQFIVLSRIFEVDKPGEDDK